jgi:signal transduction histidine kinase
LQRIDRNAESLLELINTTLDLSRLEAGRAELDVEDVPLGALLAELATEASEQPEKSHLSFRCDIATDLPPLHTDPMKLKLVVRNLLNNAFKFTEQGSVVMTAQQRDSGIDITVTDTGVGIAAESLPIIFEPFRQADASMSRRYGGVGLGLHIVRRLLDVLGGSIQVESAVGHGSTFRVRLPLAG